MTADPGHQRNPQPQAAWTVQKGEPGRDLDLFVQAHHWIKVVDYRRGALTIDVTGRTMLGRESPQ